jgi:drug/metabolite transporter (DMT)-like permease
MLALFAIWYTFNAAYNVLNAHLKVFPHPITISVIQLVVGLFYVLPLWVLNLRSRPKLGLSDVVHLLPIAALNALGHTTTVIATFEKGGGTFAHVIKASEPVVSVLLALMINRVAPKPLTLLSLVPITYGVAYASTLGELNVGTMSTELTTTAAK